eukprot:1186898-Prorocentrum_minimum.AAC.1
MLHRMSLIASSGGLRPFVHAIFFYQHDVKRGSYLRHFFKDYAKMSESPSSLRFWDVRVRSRAQRGSVVTVVPLA